MLIERNGVRVRGGCGQKKLTIKNDWEQIDAKKVDIYKCNVEMQMGNNSRKQLLDGAGLLFRVSLPATGFLRHAAWNARIVVSCSHS